MSSSVVGGKWEHSLNGQITGGLLNSPEARLGMRDRAILIAERAKQ